MIIDSSENISKYSSLVPSILNIEKELSYPVEEMTSFNVNRKHSILIRVEEGSIMLATTWREGKGEKDVTGAFTLHKGEMAIILAGEYYIIKGEGKCYLSVLD